MKRCEQCGHKRHSKMFKQWTSWRGGKCETKRCKLCINANRAKQVTKGKKKHKHWHREQRQMLTDYHIRSLLKRSGVPITPQLIELKRIQLQLQNEYNFRTPRAIAFQY